MCWPGSFLSHLETDCPPPEDVKSRLVSPLCSWEIKQGQLTQRTTSAKKAFKDPYYCFNKSGSASFLQEQGHMLTCPLPRGLTSLQSVCTLATQQTLLQAHKSSPHGNYRSPGCWSHLEHSLCTAPVCKMQQLVRNQTGHNKTRTWFCTHFTTLHVPMGNTLGGLQGPS